MTNASRNADQPLLTFTIEGPEVKSGRIEVEHLTAILQAFQKSLWLVTDQLLKDLFDKVSRQEKNIARRLATLEVVAFASGSFSVTLDFAPRPKDLPQHVSELSGQRAIKTVLHNLRLAAEGNGTLLDSNRGGIRAISPFGKMAPLFANGVRSIRVQFDGESSAILDHDVCQSIEALTREERHHAVNTDVQTIPSGLIDKLTASDLLHSPLIGIWSDRHEMGDSAEFSREIRESAQIRKK